MTGRVAHAMAWARVVVLVLAAAACQTPPNAKPDESLLHPPGGYDYPWTDPYVATVVGTPPQQRARLPESVPTEEHVLSPGPHHRIPTVFWYQRGLRYALTAQPNEAPLVFLIAGTGAGPTARHVEVLTRIFYAGGYHVLALPSPTFSNFIVNASSTGVPGQAKQDTRDLYHLMRRAYAEVRRHIGVTAVSLVGYSLGAWHAAFVAHLDENEHAFGFRRVLMINPPVNLYRSSTILDRLLVDNLPGGIDGLPVFFNELFRSLSSLYTKSAGPSDLTGDFLYQAYLELKPSDQVLAALIGLVFRLTATDLAFTADVMSDEGYLVPHGTHLGVTSSLTPYLVEGLRRGFSDYLTELLLPFYRQKDPELTLDRLIANSDLDRIGDYLAASAKIRLITNADEIINTPEEIAYLRRVFADRAKIFPYGGHCGNFQYPQVVAAMLNLLTD